MRVHESVYIERAVGDVFDFIADRSNDHRWRREVLTSSIMGDVREGVGTHVHQRISYQGRTADANFEITEFSPGSRICFRAHGGVRAHGGFEVRAEDSGTRLDVSASVELKGAASMLERYVRQAVEQAARDDLGQLKRVLER